MEKEEVVRGRRGKVSKDEAPRQHSACLIYQNAMPKSDHVDARLVRCQ